jgi:hypothetical protein
MLFFLIVFLLSFTVMETFFVVVVTVVEVLFADDWLVVVDDALSVSLEELPVKICGACVLVGVTDDVCGSPVVSGVDVPDDACGACVLVGANAADDVCGISVVTGVDALGDVCGAPSVSLGSDDVPGDVCGASGVGATDDVCGACDVVIAGAAENVACGTSVVVSVGTADDAGSSVTPADVAAGRNVMDGAVAGMALSDSASITVAKFV